jgi:hypothetical protein
MNTRSPTAPPSARAWSSISGASASTTTTARAASPISATAAMVRRLSAA